MLALALAASAAVALHSPTPVLERPSAARIATAPAVIPDSTLSAPKNSSATAMERLIRGSASS